MRVLTVGGATYDIFLHYKSAQSATIDNRCFVILEEGSKIDVDAITYYSGGGATNCGVSFARLGFHVDSFFKIGTDLQGTFILDDLAKEGVNTHHVTTPEVNTSSSIIIPCISGERTILCYRGASATLQPDEIPLDLITGKDLLYVTSLSGKASDALPLIAKYAHEHGVRVVVNPGSSQMKSNPSSIYNALPFIDILILNEYEAGLCWLALLETDRALQKKFGANSFDLKNYFTEILAHGVSVAVVTSGAHGVRLATKNEMSFHPSIPIKVVSSVGAGDAFASCFAAQLLQGKNIEDALRMGIINAASVITHIGAKTGLLTQSELENKLSDLDNSLLKRFTLN